MGHWCRRLVYACAEAAVFFCCTMPFSCTRCLLVSRNNVRGDGGSSGSGSGAGAAGAAAGSGAGGAAGTAGSGAGGVKGCTLTFLWRGALSFEPAGRQLFCFAGAGAGAGGSGAGSGAGSASGCDSWTSASTSDIVCNCWTFFRKPCQFLVNC